MKIVHLSASDRAGGAAIAAWQLHRGLIERGIDSHLVVHRKTSDDDTVSTATPADGDRAEPVAAADTIQRVYGVRNRSDRSNTHFSMSIRSIDVSRHAHVRDADIIHLHWVASFQNCRSLSELQKLGKPIVWTLHDLQPFTGGCHFPAGCDGFRASCADCPQLHHDPFAVPAAELRDKRALWRGAPPALIAPTLWMAKQARRSSVFAGAAPRVIPNAVDVEVFRPRVKSEARARLGLADAGVYVLCGADHGGERRKGFDALGKILGQDRGAIGVAPKIDGVIWVGRQAPDWHPQLPPLHKLGRLEHGEAMALVFAAADLFVLTSSEDNIPNMVLEAMSCGTPVVAFAVGGIPETVLDGAHGRLVSAGDIPAMTRAIDEMIADPARRHEMSERGRFHISNFHSRSHVAGRHLALYRELAARTANSPHAEVNGAPFESAVAALMPALELYCLRREASCLREELQASEADRHARLAVIRKLDREAEAAFCALSAVLSASDGSARDVASLAAELACEYRRTQDAARAWEEQARTWERHAQALEERAQTWEGRARLLSALISSTEIRMRPLRWLARRMRFDRRRRLSGRRST